MDKITYNIPPILSGKSNVAEITFPNKAKCNTPQKCQIQETHSSITCAYYPPIYDGYGNNLNPDRNTTTRKLHCNTCGKEWTE